jgi:predicted RNase H-like HicB family nuclease
MGLKVLVITEKELISFFPPKSISLEGEIDFQKLDDFLNQIFRSSKLVVISLVKNWGGRQALREVLQFASQAGITPPPKFQIEKVYDATREFLPLREFITDKESLEKLIKEAKPVWEEIVPDLVDEEAKERKGKGKRRLKTL